MWNSNLWNLGHMNILQNVENRRKEDWDARRNILSDVMLVHFKKKKNIEKKMGKKSWVLYLPHFGNGLYLRLVFLAKKGEYYK